MSISAVPKLKKTPEELLDLKRKRDREAKKRQRARDPEGSRKAAAKWRSENKGKIAKYNKAQNELAKSDPVKMEKKRRRNRVENLSDEQVEKQRQRGREYSKRKTQEARDEGTTRYAKETTPETRQRDTDKMARWRKDNPERAKEIGRKSTKKYREKRGIMSSIDTAAFKVLRFALIEPSTCSKYFPGHTGLELRDHIVSTIPEGWGLLHYGIEWEIDHIIPLSSFTYDSVDDDEFKKCWGLGNLRACCKTENKKKGDSNNR